MTTSHNVRYKRQITSPRDCKSSKKNSRNYMRNKEEVNGLSMVLLGLETSRLESLHKRVVST